MHTMCPESTIRDVCRQAALLTIGGLDLDPLLGKGSLDGIMNWEGDRQDMRRAAAALGYLAAAVERLGFYLDIPLRYPIKPGNCKSLILSHADVAGTYRWSSCMSVCMPVCLSFCLCVCLVVCSAHELKCRCINHLWTANTMQHASMYLLLACSRLKWVQETLFVALQEFVLVPVSSVIHLCVTCCDRKVTVNAPLHANFSMLSL